MSILKYRILGSLLLVAAILIGYLYEGIFLGFTITVLSALGVYLLINGSLRKNSKT